MCCCHSFVNRRLLRTPSKSIQPSGQVSDAPLIASTSSVHAAIVSCKGAWDRGGVGLAASQINDQIVCRLLTLLAAR